MDKGTVSMSNPRKRTPRRGNEQPLDPAKRATLKKLAAAGLLTLLDLGGLAGCWVRRTPTSRAREPKMIIVGLDGLDPGLVSRLMAEGKLPSMRRLKALGGLAPLTSTIPPQSPVAWASFITGRDPGGHGIYDFLHRDVKTYLPYFAIARSEDASLSLSLGNWRLPLVGGRVELERFGRTFWELLAEEGIPASIYRVPSNFPPRDTGARQLAGLGAPDLRGSYGEFSYYTDDLLSVQRQVTGGNVYRVSASGSPIRAALHGPRDSLKRGEPDATIPLEIWLDRGRKLAKIVAQGNEILLRQGEWSDWLTLHFSLVPHLKSVSGICRFYLKEAAPHLKLYVTPINIDPLHPALPIAAPLHFSRELAERFGLFFTQGFPHDVKALRQGILDDDEYLHQSGLILGEARRMYESALDEFRRGLLFYYFSTTDRTQHMFWRTMDPRHPAYDPKLARTHGKAVEQCYQAADDLVAQALAATDGDTILIVLSDHGFGPYYRSFHLNTWLAQNGYLAGLRAWGPGHDLFSNADWENTMAYGLGFNALYLNLRGREPRGCVTAQQRDGLAKRIADDLRRLRDPETGERIVENVYDTRQAFSKLHADRAPDLIVGYRPGYRCSDRSALGEVADRVVEMNRDKWSGDHCFDRSAMPGVLLANRPFTARAPSLTDVTASILAVFGIPIPSDMTGAPIW